MLILDNLLLHLPSLAILLVHGSLGIDSRAIQTVGRQDLVLEAWLLLSGQRFAQDDVVVGAAGDACGSGLFVACYLDWYV